MKHWLWLGVLAGCNFGFSGVKGSGTAKSEARPATGFTAVAIGGSLETEITIGPDAKVELSGDDNLLPLIETSVSGTTLKVTSTKSYSTSQPLRLKIVMPHVTAIDVSGAGTLQLHGAHEDALAITVSGSGSLHADGTARQLTAKVTGSGDLVLDHLATERASIHVTGSGDATLDVSQALDARVAGSGTVKYRGSPTVTKDISGSGELTKL